MTLAAAAPGTPAAAAADDALRFYRFRSVDALVGPRQELANQEIFFAAPADLNDPLEGFHDIVWRGDAIAWRNHLRHYLLCLLQTATALHVGGPAYDALEKHDFSGTTADRLPTPQFRALFETVAAAFFADARAGAYPRRLAERGSIRREEVLFYLWTLHGHALRVILAASEQAGLRPRGAADGLSGWGAPPLDEVYFETLSLAVAEAGGEDAASGFYAATRAIFDQQQILSSQDRDPGTPGWSGLLFDFPAAYLDRLRGLMHPPWYTACFVDNCRHPAMWGQLRGRPQGRLPRVPPDVRSRRHAQSALAPPQWLAKFGRRDRARRRCRPAPVPPRPLRGALSRARVLLISGPADARRPGLPSPRTEPAAPPARRCSPPRRLGGKPTGPGVSAP